VKDRRTKERFPKEANLERKVTSLMGKHRLLGRASDVIYLSPPLCITRDEVDHLVGELDALLTELEGVV
jgi:adenosylmethionine-8-amino-7-oxononanoate aminotransferase